MSDDPTKKPGAAGDPGASGIDLSISPVLQKLNPQPFDLRKFEIITGYISEVTEDRVRVYLSLDFQILLDIPRSAIEMSEKEQPGQKLSATRLLVDATALIRVIKVTSYEAELGFLTGSISAEHLPEATVCVPEDASEMSSGQSVSPKTTCHPVGRPKPTTCISKTICVTMAPIHPAPPKPTTCISKTICVTMYHK